MAEGLWKLISLGYEIDWFCYVGSHAMEHAVELDRAVMTRLLAVPGDLLLDFCDDAPDER